MEATIPHSAEEWHGLSYNDGNYNIIIEKFVDQDGKELVKTVTTAGKEESSPKAIPAYEEIQENYRTYDVDVSKAKNVHVTISLDTGTLSGSEDIEVPVIKVGRSWYLDLSSL